MKEPTAEQQKRIRDLAARTPGNPGVIPPGGTPTPDLGIVIKWKKGEFIIDAAENAELDRFSQEFGRPVVEWINENC
jgi:hypothetical protein